VQLISLTMSNVHPVHGFESRRHFLSAVVAEPVRVLVRGERGSMGTTSRAGEGSRNFPTNFDRLSD
jgi:hypothetical protein